MKKEKQKDLLLKKEFLSNMLNYILLNTNMTITDVCFTSGFTNISSFSRDFKNKYNISPTEIRKHPDPAKIS